MKCFFTFLMSIFVLSACTNGARTAITIDTTGKGTNVNLASNTGNNSHIQGAINLNYNSNISTNNDSSTTRGIAEKFSPVHTLTSEGLASTASDNLDVLMVDGRQYTLNQLAAPSLINHRLSYARFGRVYENTGAIYHFAQGTPTLTMPSTGMAYYYGSAIHTANGITIADATSHFVVDYASHTVNGVIKNNDIMLAQIHANMYGNTFRGTAADGTTTQGRFYGENAAELAGIYRHQDSYAGSYGAKR